MLQPCTIDIYVFKQYRLTYTYNAHQTKVLTLLQ